MLQKKIKVKSRLCYQGGYLVDLDIKNWVTSGVLKLRIILLLASYWSKNKKVPRLHGRNAG